MAHEIEKRTGEPAQDGTPFDGYALKWLNQDKKPTVTPRTFEGTYRIYVEDFLVPFFGKKSLQEITKRDVKRLYAQNSHLALSSLKKLRLCMSSIMSAAQEDRLIYNNPAKGVKLFSDKAPNVKHAYTDDQIAVLSDALHDLLPPAVIQLGSGLRPGEVCALGPQHCIERGGKYYLNVERNITDDYEIRPPKWNSFRLVPIAKDLFDFIIGLPVKEGYFFWDQRGQHLTTRVYYKQLERSIARINAKRIEAELESIPSYTPNELRHTYGTNLRRKGVDIYTIKTVMGHKSVEITAKTYVKDELDVATAALENVNAI